MRVMESSDLLPMGTVARRSGFAASAIRFYEEQGLVSASRTPGGHRVFERSTLRRLAFIRAASNVGLSLDEIRGELDRLPGRRTPTEEDWERISQHWRARLDERIAALETLRDGLTACIGCGCLSLERCRVSNPQDEVAFRDGDPGAAFLPRDLRAEASPDHGGSVGE